MTRSVEIPEEAVEAAATACHESDFAWSSEGIHDEYWRKMGRAALEAALPYLAPAGSGLLEEHRCTNLDPHKPHTWAYEASAFVCDGGAPAGDGGLREALEKLCDRYELLAEELSIRGGLKATYDIPGSELRSLLAAHPAAPAVPQPQTDDGEVAPSASLVPTSAGVETANTSPSSPLGGIGKYFSNGGPDTPIMTVWNEGVEMWAAPADDIRELIAQEAAVPQPVDREALRDAVQAAISSKTFTMLGDGDPVCGVMAATDAVLALLAGEQEQVESQQ